MKKSLTFLVVVFVIVSCKKDKSTVSTSTPAEGRYTLSKVSDISPLMVFTVNGQINAPNHPSAQDEDMVNFEDYLQEELVPEVTGNSLRFGPNNKVTLEAPNQEAQEVPYERVGNLYLVDDYLVFELINNKMILRNYEYLVVKESNNPDGTSVYFGSGGGGVYTGELKDIVIANLSQGDTAAVRSYNLVFEK